MENLYVIRNKKALERLIDLLKDRRPPFKVFIQEMPSQRTVDQNAYYFGVVCKIIGDYTGETVEEVHRRMKRYFRVEYYLKGKEWVFGVKSTTLDGITDFWDYVNKVCWYAQSFYEITIPLPNEVPVNDMEIVIKNL